MPSASLAAAAVAPGSARAAQTHPTWSPGGATSSCKQTISHQLRQFCNHLVLGKLRVSASILKFKEDIIQETFVGEDNIVKKLPEVDSSEELCVQDCRGGESDQNVGHVVEHVDDQRQDEDGRRLIQPDETFLFLRATASRQPGLRHNIHVSSVLRILHIY